MPNYYCKHTLEIMTFAFYHFVNNIHRFMFSYLTLCRLRAFRIHLLSNLGNYAAIRAAEDAAQKAFQIK